MKCEECDKECTERFRQMVRIPKDRSLKLSDLSPEQMTPEYLEDIEIMICKQCWEKFDLLYKQMRESFQADAEHLLKKAGDELPLKNRKQLEEMLDQFKDE